MKRLLGYLLIVVGVSCLAQAGSLDLQILHASDFEAGIAALQEAPRFSQVLEALKSDYPSNTLVVSSGDNYINGPFFMASADKDLPFHGVKGRADIVIANNLGIQASVFGNHEFDTGPIIIRDLLKADPSVGYPGTCFPYLAANLIFTNEPNLRPLLVASGQDWSVMTNRIAGSTVVTVAGEKIGIVGATTPELKKVTNPGLVTVDDDFVGVVQRSVDQLYNQGIKKIILLAHLQQLGNEVRLAGQLTNVSVIVAGGSHRILAKKSDRLRHDDVRYGDYPLTHKDAAGKKVYIVNTQNGYRYVGRLIVHFDSNDVITAIDSKSGAYATDEQGVRATGSFPANTNIVRVIRQLENIIDLKDGQVFGRIDVYLNGRDESVRSSETNLGDLVADANLYRAQLTDSNVCISLRNGGGIRDSIGAVMESGAGFEKRPSPANPRVGKKEGDISRLDIENALRFNNGLTILTVTAQQLRDALEWSLACSGTCGQFPQVSGLVMSFNPTNTPISYVRSNNVVAGIACPGDRLRSLVVILPGGQKDVVVVDGVLIGDPNRQFRMITMDYMANGGDGFYPLTLGTDRIELIPPGTTKTFMTDGAEQRALADYLLSIQHLQAKDYTKDWERRIMNLSRNNVPGSRRNQIIGNL